MKKVAIVGCSFRFPGTSQANYWSDLLNSKDLVTEVDPARWALDTFRHPSKTHAGTSYTFASGTLGDVSTFDAEFFGISPREAAQMDPQQRLLLEMSWEAFENAGIKPSNVKGSKCGVFIGISSTDYAYRFADDLAAVDSTVATGNTASIAANRISYVFDLKGPSMALDTACSSSLVAFHQACQSIAVGESAMAIAGGVSLHLHPYGFIAFSKASMLSRKGHCNVFDAAGDGYVRSEGGGIFVLKDYEQALADGDPILAIVAGTAVNSDGKKSGLTVPSKTAQATLLKETYAAAGIAPADISYIEAHGTGTPVGDPIETSALADALGKFRSASHPLLIGSVKSNVGHLEAASGIAGLVKALHCVQHRTVPATINVRTLNPNIPFKDWNLQVVTQTTPLPIAGRIIVGINSFGFGGTNAHVILESPIAKVTALRSKQAKSTNPIRVPLIFSGKNEAALKASAKNIAQFLREKNDTDFYDVAYNAAFHREWHEHRAVVFGGTSRSVATALAQFAEGSSPNIAMVSTTALGVPQATPPTVAFIYSGNGSQWEGMGRRLLVEDPIFKAAIQSVEQIFDKYADFSLEEELAGNNGLGRYSKTEIAQPALFAIQVGITEMLRSQGVMPTVVAGHSVGEVAAAWAAGALTLEQAVLVIFQRSHFQGKTHGLGQMCAVALGATETQFLLQESDLSTQLTVAGVNSARGVTLAGPKAALTQFEAVLADRKVVFKRLDLDYAFHSSAMDALQPGIEQALSTLTPRKGHIDFISTVSGEAMSGELLDASYWWRNIRQPVLFSKAIETLRQRGVGLFVEVGPHPVLRGYINECIKSDAQPGRTIPTLSRQEGFPEQVWSAASQTLLAGANVDLTRFFPHEGRFTTLPNYPWQREHHWQTVTSESYKLLQRHRVHPLLGYPLEQHELTWENQIDPLLHPQLADHVVGGAIVFPGTGFAEIGLAVAAQWASDDGLPVQLELEELEIKTPLVLHMEHTKLVRIALDASDGSFSITAREQFSNDAWLSHAHGRVMTEPLGVLFAQETWQAPDRLPDFDAQIHAQLTQQVGLNYGPAFQAVDVGWVEPGKVWARLKVPDSIAVSMPQSLLHPALLDCSFQLIIHLMRDQLALQSGIAYVPTKIGRLSLLTGMGSPVAAKAQLVRQSPHSLTAHFSLFDDAGRLIAWLRDVRFRSVPLSKDAADPLRLVTYEAIPKAHALSAAQHPTDFAQLLQEDMSTAARSLGENTSALAYSQEVEPLLDALCVSFAVEAFILLSGDKRTLTEQQAQQLAQRNLQASTVLGRLITILEEEQLLEHIATDWQLRDVSDITKSSDIWNALIADYPEHFAAFNAIGRIGLNMVALAKGEANLAQLLPRDYSFASLVAQSLGVIQRTHMGLSLAHCAKAVVAQLAEGQRLSIVEIGNSTPTFSADLLRTLDADRCDITFATTSADALDFCQRHVERWPGIALAGLSQENREVPPVKKAHLVIVLNDFQTEADAQLALDSAASLLASNGVVLWVGIPASRWLDLLFGGQTGLHSSAQHWQQQLTQRDIASGNPVYMVPESVTTPYVLIGQSTANSDTQTVATPMSEAYVWLVLADEAPIAQDLLAQLTSHLTTHNGKIVVAEASYNLTDKTSVSELLTATQVRYGKLSGIVHLYGMDASPLASMSDANNTLKQQLTRCAVASALVQACENTRTTVTCWLVTSGAASRLLPGRTTPWSNTLDAPLYGLGRTLLNESSYLSVRLLDIEPHPSSSISHPALIQSIVNELTAPDAEHEVILTVAGERFVPRLRVAPRHASPAAAPEHVSTTRLGFQTPGQLRNLRWENAPSLAPRDDEIEIAVAATGLNFRDVMYALGMLSDEAVEAGFAGPTLGLECSGVVTALGAGVKNLALGDRVLAFGASCFSNTVITKASAASQIPTHISFEAAATIPSTFFTAYYAMHHLARLRPGERILIHGAAGGVGIAAVQLAKHMGAEVFATAGSDEKRDFLRLLGVTHIFDSRSLGFADQIMAVTQGEGIDVVLNSLAGEAVNRNLRILKPFGRFLELGKRDFYENTKVGLRPFRNNISYFGIDADQLMQEQPALTESLFTEVMALFAQGVLHPLPFQAFEADEVVDAFRHMQQARQIGKIVVTYRHGINHIHRPKPVQIPLQLRPDATYLVTGGLGGFGLKTAQWLATKGARHLVLISRSGPASTEAQEAIAALEASGITVLAQACDVTKLDALTALFAQIALTLPPLRGLVHAAVVIDDALMCNTTPAQLERVFEPKILGARYLHALTQSMPLDHFVLFSSATTVFGNPGQGAYVGANAYLEALSEARRTAGLASLCVRWGAIDDVGFLARNEKIKDALQNRMGGTTIQSSDALNIMEDLMVSNRSDLGVLELDWKALSRFLPSAAEPKFCELATKGQDSGSTEENANSIQHLLEELDPAELAAAFKDLLKAEIGEILRIAPDKLDADRSVYDMGLDSLMGVELALAIETRFGIQLSVMALSESPTISKLADKIISLLKNTTDAIAEVQSEARLSAQVQQAATQHAIDIGTPQAIELFASNIQLGLSKSQRIIQ